MKGIVFIKFTEMVEKVFGEDILDEMFEASDLDSGGAYTANGYYSHEEIVQLGSHLSRLTNTPVPTLLYEFGLSLFSELVNLSTPTMLDAKDAFTFIDNIESVIHPEVKKLYPDAELPNFETLHHDANTLKLVYRSSRHFDDLAHGLMDGCLKYFGEKAKVSRHSYQDGVLFELTRISD